MFLMSTARSLEGAKPEANETRAERRWRIIRMIGNPGGPSLRKDGSILGTLEIHQAGEGMEWKRYDTDPKVRPAQLQLGTEPSLCGLS